MKKALICYHTDNLEQNPFWTEEYKRSVLSQTDNEFDIFELNYAGGNQRIFENSIFSSEKLSTFVHATNFLIKTLFEKGYDCVFNSHCDDYYHPERIEKQTAAIQAGNDIVSSNFMVVIDGKEVPGEQNNYHKLDIRKSIFCNHNVIANPVVCYSRKFYEKGLEYNPKLIPAEDLKLWQSCFDQLNFKILPDILLYYRIHPNSATNNVNSR